MISGLFHLSGVTAGAPRRIMSEDALYYNVHDTVISHKQCKRECM